MNIYKPTEFEVVSVMRRSVEKLPQLEKKWQKAVRLLLEENLWWDGKTWRCTSQSDPTHSYEVNFQSCNCPDHVKQHGRVFCKHKLALLAYREIMKEHIKDRFAGDVNNSTLRRRARIFARSLLLGSTDNDGRAILVAYADERDKIPTTICTVTYKARGILPATEADLYKFAQWLANAEPEPGSSFDAAPSGWDDLAAEGFVFNRGVWQM